VPAHPGCLHLPIAAQSPLDHLLAEFEGAGALAIHWVLFGTNGHDRPQPGVLGYYNTCGHNKRFWGGYRQAISVPIAQTRSVQEFRHLWRKLALTNGRLWRCTSVDWGRCQATQGFTRLAALHCAPINANLFLRCMPSTQIKTIVNTHFFERPLSPHHNSYLWVACCALSENV
jgi:hypothetical protein